MQSTLYTSQEVQSTYLIQAQMTPYIIKGTATAAVITDHCPDEAETMMLKAVQALQAKKVSVFTLK